MSYNKSVERAGSVKDGTVQPEWNVQDDGRGLLTGSVKFFYNYKTGTSSVGLDGMPTKGSKHPYDERLVCNNVSVNYQSNDIAYVDASYVGLKQDPSGIEWTLSAPTADEAIDKHWAFLEIQTKGGFGVFAADQPSPTTNNFYDPDTKFPIFDPQVVIANPKDGFQRFAVSDKTREKDLVGVESYLAPKCTMQVTWHTASEAYWFWAVQYLGWQISYVPLAPAWSNVTALNRSWLLTSSNVSEYSGIYKVSAEFTLSGNGKDGKGKPWNKLIYRTFSPTS